METPDSLNPRYPHIRVKLVGEDGNPFSMIGRTTSAMRKNKVPNKDIEEFSEIATNGNYHHVIATIMRWVTVY